MLRESEGSGVDDVLSKLFRLSNVSSVLNLIAPRDLELYHEDAQRLARGVLS